MGPSSKRRYSWIFDLWRWDQNLSGGILEFFIFEGGTKFQAEEFLNFLPLKMVPQSKRRNSWIFYLWRWYHNPSGGILEFFTFEGGTKFQAEEFLNFLPLKMGPQSKRRNSWIFYLWRWDQIPSGGILEFFIFEDGTKIQAEKFLNFFTFEGGTKIQAEEFLNSLPLKVGPIGCHETSVRNYHNSLHNNPEVRSFRSVRYWHSVLGDRNKQGIVGPSHCPHLNSCHFFFLLKVALLKLCRGLLLVLWREIWPPTMWFTS